ncbi:MAG: prohibitin family protein [Terracidiphilus sp.]|jgi:regulator of protease activity HflC (stomatin/prohibitin superfamily)
MFIVGCVFLLLAFASSIAAHRLRINSSALAKADGGHSSHILKEEIPGINPGFTVHALTIIASASTVAGLLFMVAACITSVSAGQVGVPVIYGSVQPYIIPEGLHTINPFASVTEMSVRSQTYTMVSAENEGEVKGDDSIFAQSSDGVVLTLNVSIVYKLVDADAPWVYRHLGTDYAGNIVRSAARSAVPDSTSQFTFEEAYASKRAPMAEMIRTRMNASINEILRQYSGFSGAGVVIQQVFIREVKPSAQLLTAIEEKMTAQQQAQQMDFTLDKERKEAQRKAIEAQGIQDFQNIVTKGITEPLLKWKGIEATEKLAASSNAKVVIIGGKDGLPVILGQQ